MNIEEYDTKYDFSSVMSPAVKLAVRTLINVLLVFAMHTYLSAYITIFGGPPAYVIIGALLTILNLSLRPLLAIITLPFRLFFSLFTSIAVNAFFLFVVYEIALRMDPSIVVMTITGGITGWIIVSCILGIGNWVLKHIP
jgi:uncharacterized membrane protein YvlD (DUF360 family)